MVTFFTRTFVKCFQLKHQTKLVLICDRISSRVCLKIRNFGRAFIEGGVHLRGRLFQNFKNSGNTQAFHGLAPKCELINMHELINKSTNKNVTVLPSKNGADVTTKDEIAKNANAMSIF